MKLNWLIDEAPNREVNKGTNSFDVLRYFFAFSLILVHFCTLTDIPQFWFISGGTRVKAFFIITGFLVLYSYEHSSMKTYWLKRAARILPAYICCILLCLVLGMVLSDLPLTEFIGNPQTWRYLVSNLLFLNFIEPSLPGTFGECVMTPINGSLWSMKVEVLFYIILPLLVWCLRRWRKGIVLCVFYALSVVYSMVCEYLYARTGNNVIHLLQHQLMGQMVFFLGGMTMLIYFRQLNRHWRWLLPVCFILFLFSKKGSVLSYLEPITFGVVIIAIAYHTPWLTFLYRRTNVSYGLYLYHFPVVQTLVHFGVTSYNIYLAFFLTLAITFVIATISWYGLEKPILDKVKS